MENTSELVVYKASAGSGKTFTLAVEYIKLLIENPREYRNILAVTFTNKATAEMKERILSQLLGIATNDKDSDAYFNVVQERTGKTETEIRTRAAQALNYIIHDYSRFRVETIDSFFQSVMRNLARELELNVNLNIELDSQEALGQAVDALLEKLDRQSPMLTWILEYINEKIQEDKNWNVSRDIKKFGTNIFNEDFIERGESLRKKLQDPQFLYQYRKLLQELRTEVLEQMKGFADQFFGILESNGLDVSDLKSGKNIASYFLKMRAGNLEEKNKGATIERCLSEGPAAWFKSTSKQKDLIKTLAETELIPLTETCEEFRRKNNRILNSCELSLKHINTLQLLNSIHREVQLQNQEKNRFLLADTNALLHNLLREEDSSFVFEKIGTNIKHVMIDEFQDTSKMQWSNFKMLLLEGLSQGENSLIVGDVKQSIYRWRGGDWNILNGLNKRIEAFPIRTVPLQTNRRSFPNIIQFNNSFFPQALQYLNETYGLNSQELEKAYADVAQQWVEPKAPNSGRGYIKVAFLPETTEKRYDETTLEKLVAEVQRLIEAGARQSEIAILVRKRKDIPTIADHFDTYTPYKLISAEAFMLSASQVVCMLINALRYLDNPHDPIAKANLVVYYQRNRGLEEIDLNKLLIEKPEKYLPKKLCEKQEEYRMMPLYELLEQLYRLLCGEEEDSETKTAESTKSNQDAYLLTFFDSVMEYLTDHSSDLSSFLQYWEEELSKKNIPANEQEGIRIMTIHTSKGLEFNHVLIPFCDWKLTGEKSSMVWCSTKEEPFNRLDLAPINFQESMAESVYKNDYLHELIQLLVDNLNVLYVAFTRPKQSLIVFCKQKTIRGTVTQMLQQSLQNAYSKQGENPSDDISFRWENESTFEFGTLQCQSSQSQHTSRNPLLQKPVPCSVDIISTAHQPEFLQSNQSAQFINGKDDESDNTKFINQGLLLHAIFSNICTTEDTDKVIRQLLQEGVIASLREADSLRKIVQKALAHPQAKDWFSGRYRLYNECKIVWMKDEKPVENRPDRVMINENETIVVDFKFGRPKEQYHQQVQDYIRLLEKMGYPNVKGYLWYVYTETIETVKPT